MFRPLATAALLLVGVAPAYAKSKPEVTYRSPCACEESHGVARWRAKTELSEPERIDVHPITPSEMFSWKGPTGMPRGGGRSGNELSWFALTGRVTSVLAEDDGDIHMVLVDANGTKRGKVVVEIPLGARWCPLRTVVFSWMKISFPFKAGSALTSRLTRHPVITVTGKAFFDTDHSGKDATKNRRRTDKSKAVWEIHPVMALSIGSKAPIQSIRPVIPSVQPFVTITRPIVIDIPYGKTTLQPGTKLPFISLEGTQVRVRYLGEIELIPAASTDLP
ncbi:MAG: hypothetical protein ABJB09_01395 [Verrucomicrobiota bacterium]